MLGCGGVAAVVTELDAPAPTALIDGSAMVYTALICTLECTVRTLP